MLVCVCIFSYMCVCNVVILLLCVCTYVYSCVCKCACVFIQNAVYSKTECKRNMTTIGLATTELFRQRQLRRIVYLPMRYNIILVG